jgi:4a-hydroxytetrahydrobiopterin dehydratase
MWEEENNQLQCSFEFNNFVDAFAFMTKVAFAAEKMGHHPNWTNMYKKVHIQLCTHDANDTITEKDIQLTKEIDAIFN